MIQKFADTGPKNADTENKFADTGATGGSHPWRWGEGGTGDTDTKSNKILRGYHYLGSQRSGIGSYGRGNTGR